MKVCSTRVLLTRPVMRCTVPYAALLLNGHKVLETRKTPFLAELSGQMLAIHIGRKQWPSEKGGERGWLAAAPTELLDEPGSWRKACALPEHIERGMIAGVVCIGDTHETAQLAKKHGWNWVEQRSLVARKDIARYSTEVTTFGWLPQGMPSTPRDSGVWVWY
jgi:hypothetical protein